MLEALTATRLLHAGPETLQIDYTFFRHMAEPDMGAEARQEPSDHAETGVAQAVRA